MLSQRKQAEREERVDLILGAARKLFLEKGYIKTTIRDIASESQLSTGAVYFYFQNKEDIFFKVVEEALGVLRDMLQDAETGEGDGMKKMRAVVQAYSRFYQECNDQYRVLDAVTAWRGMLSPEKVKDMIGEVGAHLNITETSLQLFFAEKGIEDKDCRKLTYNLWAGVEGLLSIDKMGYLAGEPYSLGELLDEQLDIFERGLFSP